MFKRTYLLSILLVLMLLVVACGETEEPRPEVDPSIMETLVDITYAGEMVALSGEQRDATLMLLTDAQGAYVFSLDYLYVGRTQTPTNRTGLWYFDGQTLILDVIEQDGEPVDQPSLTFAVADQRLLGTIYDKSYFDVEDLVLQRIP